MSKVEHCQRAAPTPLINMDTTNSTYQSSIQSEEFTQGKMFLLFDWAIELAEDRAKWEIPVAKLTERYLQILKDLRKAFFRHIKDNPIDTDKVLAKLRAKVEYKNARNEEKERQIARMEANIAEITTKTDQIKQEMQAVQVKWKEENSTMTITPEMAAYRKSKVRKFDRCLKSLSEQINTNNSHD